MTNRTKKIFPLAFYDGPTEGLVVNWQIPGTFYFKVIAWDRSQDQRLYALGKIDARILEELLKLFPESTLEHSDHVWKPDWGSATVEISERADELIRTAADSLNGPVTFALGTNLISDTKVVDPSKRQLAAALLFAKERHPGNLEEWLALR